MGCLERKTVIVTGAGRGLGAAYARLAASEGASVVINDIDGALAESVAGQIRDTGGKAMARAADISSWEQARDLIDSCVQAFGSVDGLVNNAGLHHMALPEEETESRIRAVVESNVYGTLFCGLHAIDRMRKQGAGSIVNVCSGAQTGISRMAVYGATKGAVASLTYSWSMDLAPLGIRVNAISPLARSAMSEATYEYFVRRGEPPKPNPNVTPEQNAPLVVYLLSDLSRAVNGQVVRIDGSQLALMTHPAVLHPPLRRDSWTVADIQAAFLETLEARQIPTGTYAVTQHREAYQASRPDASPRAAGSTSQSGS